MHAAINNFFKKLNQASNSFYESGLTRADIEYKKPVYIGFSILQNAKLRKLKCTTTFPLTFVIWTSSNSWKWTQIIFILLLPRRNWMVESNQKLKNSVSAYDQRISPIVSLLMQAQIFSPEKAVTGTKNTREKVWIRQRGIQLHRVVVLM